MQTDQPTTLPPALPGVRDFVVTFNLDPASMNADVLTGPISLPASDFEDCLQVVGRIRRALSSEGFTLGQITSIELVDPD